MFFKFKIEFGFGRKRREEVDYDDDDDMPHTVVESTGSHERAPIGFSVSDPWEEDDRRGRRTGSTR